MEREPGTSAEIITSLLKHAWILMWVLELELRLSCLSTEHFTNQTVFFFLNFLVQVIVLFDKIGGGVGGLVRSLKMLSVVLTAALKDQKYFKANI